MNASCGSRYVIRPMQPVASRVPNDGPTCVHEALRPRLSGAPCSTEIRTAPAHSPPSAMPCTKRSATSRMGLQMPAVAYVGKRPIRPVVTPISISVTTSTQRRPSLSPRWPKITPPIGREI
ncbi:hypothetical protein D3C72_1971040 [compost metagenome]